MMRPVYARGRRGGLSQLHPFAVGPSLCREEREKEINTMMMVVMVVVMNV